MKITIQREASDDDRLPFDIASTILEAIEPGSSGHTMLYDFSITGRHYQRHHRLGVSVEVLAVDFEPESDYMRLVRRARHILQERGLNPDHVTQDVWAAACQEARAQ